MSNTIKPLPFWRIDVGTSDAESSVRAMARKVDAAGNNDGKVSKAEVDTYDARLDAVMGSHRFSAWTDPTQDPVKKQAWVDHNLLGHVRDDVERPQGLAADLAIKTFGGALNALAGLMWFGPSVWVNGKKIG
jgi:hypothetical protein